MSAEGSLPDDLAEAERCDHLACQCWSHKALSDAASYYRQALAARERVFGLDHWEVADSLVRLAGVGENGWGAPAAEALWHRAIGIYERYYREGDAERGELFKHVFMGLVGTLSNAGSPHYEMQPL